MRKTTYASKGPEVTLRSIWCRRNFDIWCNSWETENKIANMRLRPNFIRESQLVERGIAQKSNTCKNHHKDNILNEQDAKKIHETGNCELHKTKFKQLITDAYMRFQDTTGSVQACTRSHNWKYDFAMNQNSDSKFQTQASSRIRRRACLGKPRSINSYI